MCYWKVYFQILSTHYELISGFTLQIPSLQNRIRLMANIFCHHTHNNRNREIGKIYELLKNKQKILQNTIWSPLNSPPPFLSICQAFHSHVQKWWVHLIPLYSLCQIQVSISLGSSHCTMLSNSKTKSFFSVSMCFVA